MLATTEFEETMVTTTDFQRKASTYINKIGSLVTPLFITKSSKVEAVLLPPNVYNELLNSAKRAEDYHTALAVMKARAQTDNISYDLNSPEVQELFADL